MQSRINSRAFSTAAEMIRSLAKGKYEETYDRNSEKELMERFSEVGVLWNE